MCIRDRVSTAVSNASYETDTSVDEGDLTEAEKKPLTREQLQVYMTEPVKTESNRHQGLQEKLNQILKQSAP